MNEMLSITHVATRSILILCLVIKTSKVKADLVNVAFGKSTSQFGGEPPSKNIWPSSNAVDGVKECTAVTARYYTLTAESHDPWWMVNLGDQFRIQEIIVHGRHDNITTQLHGFRLYLSLNNSFNKNNIVYTNRDYNNGTIYITQNLTGVFQYMRLEVPDTFRAETTEKDGKQPGPLVLCEVEVLVNITNIALGKPASMSTVYGDMTADKSVDGNQGRDADTCNCCSHSWNEANPWLKINLLHSYKIYRITVIGRSDDNRDNRMIGGLEIYTDNSQNLAVGNNTIANNSVVTVSFPSGIIANIVELKRPRRQGNREWYLVVCEVKIYTTVSVCQVGTYRDYKEKQCKSCGHCRTQTCDKDTGTCPGGVCMAGWTGTVCNTECPTSKYSYNCNETCNTCIQMNCTKSDGVCLNGCVPGYTPNDRYCRTACDDGFYGQSCSLNCSRHCKGGVHQCNKVNGKCMQGCVDGYTGEECETGCHAPAFGKNCSLICNTCKGKTCRNTDGLCSDGCVPGYKPANRYCKTPCDAGSYGQNCSGSCSGHCLNGNKHCNTTDGTCMTGCDRGYSGYRCETKCMSGFYGFGCNETCHHCTNESSCDFKSGNCPNGCKPGFEGNLCDKECQDGYFGDCTHRCHCKDDVPCSKTDGVCTENCTFGWGGKNCSIDQSLIRQLTHVVTNQTGMFKTYDSSKAIDGKDRYDVNKCNCCSVTNGSVPSWWQIDLGDKYLIDAVKIYGRSDIGDNNYQLDNATVYACNQTMVNNNVSQTFIYRIPTITNSTVFTHHLNTSTIAQFFIVKSVKMILTICEFKLFRKVCDVGKFGTGCSHTCHCSDNKSCDSITGKCKEPGCFPGWRGESCNLKCEANSFGKNCSKTCHCINDTNCDNVNGQCDEGECAPGWIGASCQTKCESKSFGMHCSQTCHCINGTNCDNVNGHCDKRECDPGWIGESCQTECESKSFGMHCSQTCHCINGTNCDNVNGHCDKRECDPGWIGESCQTECHSRFFGKNCDHICHCVNETNCDHVNGQCDKHECDPGWTGASCETECESKSFGKNCSQTCHCINGTHCDNVNGYCDKRECDPGWTGESCQTQRQSSSKASSAAIGGGIGATVALVIIAVIIGFIIYRRRNVKDSSDKTNKFTNLDKALDSRRQRLSERYVPSKFERVNRSFEGEEETSMTQSGSGEYYSFGENFGVRIYELWDYIRTKMENKCEKFYSEFKTLPSGLVHPCKSAESLVNKGKNRYKEMYAYDHSRVVLDVEEGTHTDYINACYIDGYDKTKKFVASQGPTKQMIDDFWRMVWQLKSDKIVMLTDLIEMGTVKCLQYWPIEDEEEEHCFGKVIVKVLNTESFLDYNIRLFEVRKNGEPARRIRQFHFKSWPDKDVPDSSWCLVNFWRAVNTNEPSAAGPIVVHCSAGVGRTGTFIALDNLVSQAKAEGCVRPLQVVETLRRQRVNMVQTREQYVYLHEAVADALLFGTHYVFTKQFGDMFSFMLRKEKGETKSNLEKQFELIEKSTRDTTSDAAENVEYTNVETIQSESEAYRPKLKKRGSRFVQELGAMYIPNYKGKNTFLISMSPDKNTMEEFWSLVDDSHIKTIIMLTETSAPCYQASSQLGANSKNGSKFSVNKIEEKIRKGFTERSFCFKESDREEEEYLTTVKQFEYTDWKDGSTVPGETKHMLDMINSIQKWQSHLSESQPILIHCSDGCKRSGIICVLLNELQRIQYEGGLINILESVKMMKKRQKFLIPTYEQYRFCFDLILAHSKTTEVYANI